MDEVILLTDNGNIVLDYMQNHDEVLVGKDLIESTGIKGIYPVLNSLVRKGLVTQAEPISREFINSKGETLMKEYKTYQLTELGRNFEIGNLIVVKKN